MKTFTEANIRLIEPPAGIVDYVCWDPATPGFGVRIQNGGAGTFIVQYRVGDRQRRQSLGRVGKVTLRAAKDMAQQMFSQIANRIDPAVERAKATARSAT